MVVEDPEVVEVLEEAKRKREAGVSASLGSPVSDLVGGTTMLGDDDDDIVVQAATPPLDGDDTFDSVDSGSGSSAYGQFREDEPNYGDDHRDDHRDSDGEPEEPDFGPEPGSVVEEPPDFDDFEDRAGDGFGANTSNTSGNDNASTPNTKLQEVARLVIDVSQGELETLGDAGRVGILPGDGYPRVQLGPSGKAATTEEVRNAAYDAQLKRKLGFMAGIFSPATVIREKGAGFLETAAGKPQIVPVPSGSTKHTPPTATVHRLPAVDNQAPTVVVKEPALVKPQLDPASIMGGAEDLGEVGGSSFQIPSGRPNRRASARVEMPDHDMPVPTRLAGRTGSEGRQAELPGVPGVPTGGEGPVVMSLEAFAVPDFGEPESVTAEDPGLMHHRRDQSSMGHKPGRGGSSEDEAGSGGEKGKKEAPSVPSKASKPTPVSSGAPTGLGRGDLWLAVGACLLGSLLGGYFVRSSGREVRTQDGAAMLVIEKREAVIAYLDSEIRALEYESGNREIRLAEMGRDLPPVPTPEQVTSIEVLAREKAVVEVWLTVLRARKALIVGTHRQGGV